MNKTFLALSLLISIVSCQNEQKKTVSELYGFSIDYIHSGEAGNAQALDQFTHKLTGVNWDSFQKININSESVKKELEITRITKEEQQFKIRTKKGDKEAEMEVSNLKRLELQRIINEWIRL